MARNPTAAFIVLAFVFSYSVGTSTLWLAGAFLRPVSDLAALYLGRAGVVFGPAVAALVVTHITSGREGVIRLVSRLKARREDVRWFVLLPSFTVAVTVLAYFVTGTPGTALASALAQGWPVLLAHHVLALLVVGIGEELGWRGWLLPRLLTQRSRAEATLVAAIWCPWHLPKLLRGGWHVVLFAVVILALSFLFTLLWSYARGSVLVVALAHGAVNAPWFFFEPALGWERAQAAWFVACAVYASFALGLVAMRWRWWHMEPPGVEGPMGAPVT